ncbi:MAG: hypothetical protein LBJ15_24490, partial [Comamonas sp.]|uniref:hypothetical protein n=1 Tax=Comamonas sp. TaxID=34028 RepID=UPI00281C097C
AQLGQASAALAESTGIAEDQSAQLEVARQEIAARDGQLLAAQQEVARLQAELDVAAQALASAVGTA